MYGFGEILCVKVPIIRILHQVSILLSPLILSNYDVLKLCHPPLGCYQDVVPVIASLCFTAHVPHVDAQY